MPSKGVWSKEDQHMKGESAKGKSHTVLHVMVGFSYTIILYSS